MLYCICQGIIIFEAVRTASSYETFVIFPPQKIPRQHIEQMSYWQKICLRTRTWRVLRLNGWLKMMHYYKKKKTVGPKAKTSGKKARMGGTKLKWVAQKPKWVASRKFQFIVDRFLGNYDVQNKKLFYVVIMFSNISPIILRWELPPHKIRPLR